ncbi:hypothetical protein HHL16_22430 [Pseudoflavitalea sp. G-6-1-2]|uniref:hypothetical protein n=1 Tax=Pseudoflavitalea sp. G-6-1-2 TaxID=2728841 RepID=UPI00146E5C21|nr:hypothetical protein [Pseudoflavitalea sp. G-6-1-2]NML23654.1 hypothetical protein [Pseudoflavitalea sp. G-6-1-2]
MQQHIQTIVQHFFQKESLHEVAEAELQQFTSDYPYAIIGQFLLAEKMRHDNQEKFHDQALRTSLYFNNPAWLYWQLQEHPEANLEGLKAAITMSEEPLPGLQELTTELSADEETEEEAPFTITAAEATVIAAENVSLSEGVTREEPKPAAEATHTSAVALAEAVNQAPANEIGFDPYHTIDYFASQGIKLKLEELAKDKLGQQLKSFTEWLRGMKRVGPAAINALLDDSTQHAIQSIADNSNELKDIVTEAMAEVWVKQGNYRKAITIYEKLSLQNPVKSPYFADRIQQLKAL